MKHILTFAMILLIAMISNTGAFAQNIFFNSCEQEQVTSSEIIDTIFDSFEECIKFETYNKLYLHQENIHLTKNGPVLQLKSKSLPLPNLQLDEDGPYISDSEIIQQTSIVKCIRCGWSRFSGEYCNNPACPLSKK